MVNGRRHKSAQMLSRLKTENFTLTTDGHERTRMKKTENYPAENLDQPFTRIPRINTNLSQLKTLSAPGNPEGIAIIQPKVVRKRTTLGQRHNRNQPWQGCTTPFSCCPPITRMSANLFQLKT